MLFGILFIITTTFWANEYLITTYLSLPEKDYGEAGGADTLGSDGTIAKKAAFACDNGLAGMMAWRLDNDYVDNNLSTYKGAEQLYESMSENQ